MDRSELSGVRAATRRLLFCVYTFGVSGELICKSTEEQSFERDFRVRGEESPARGEQGRHHLSGLESAKEERQCLRDTGRGSATESASTRASAKGH